LNALAGIGPEIERKLNDLGIATPDDLLAYLPRAYRDWRQPMPIGSLATDGEVIVGMVGHVRYASLAPAWFGIHHCLLGRYGLGQWAEDRRSSLEAIR